jgi:hypothetical protein
MPYRVRVLPVVLLLATARSGAQFPPGTPDRDDRGLRLKRSQVEEILKSDREKSIEDAAALAKLAEELREDLEKNDKHVLSVAAFKKTEEIEKLAKRIRGRMKRF